MSSDPRIEPFLAPFPPRIRDLSQKLRKLVAEAAPHLAHSLKPGWKLISFTGRKMVGYITPTESCVHLGFVRGAELTDPDGLLVEPAEGAKGMRRIVVKDAAGIRASSIKQLIQQAARLEASEFEDRPPLSARTGAGKSNGAGPPTAVVSKVAPARRAAATTAPPPPPASRPSPRAATNGKAAPARSGSSRVKTENVNFAKGAGGTSIDQAKYDAVRKAILAAIPRSKDGLPFKDLPRAAAMHLPSGKIPGGGSIPWYVTTVKLDLESKGVIERIPKSRPQRLRRV